METTQAGFRRLLYMYGAVTQIELNNFLEANSVDNEDRKHEIKGQWRKAAEVFQERVGTEAGMPDTVVVRPFPETARKFIDELGITAAFRETFANYPISFEEVEIDKIIASQRSVHLDFVEEIRRRFEGEKDLLKFCLHTGTEQTPLKCGRSAQNAFTLSSENPSLRFLSAYEQPYDARVMEKNHPGGQPIHAIILLVGYGIATINVFRVGKRIILNNGFHRLYALRSLGVSYAPVVVQHVTHPDLELPERIADLPRDYLVNAARPGLMKDFFDERLTCEVRQSTFLKAVQVGWGVNESRVPV